MSTGKTLFPSFLPCNPFCFCSAATGSTSSLLSQDGLCRFYFFSLIPQTHFLTGITKINDVFWFLNKKKQNKFNFQDRISQNLQFFCHCVHLCVKSLLVVNQPASQPASQPAIHQRFISCKLLCARSNSDIWRGKIVRWTCSTNSAKVNSLSPTIFIFSFCFSFSFFFILMQSSFKNLFIAVRFSLKGEGCNASAEEGGFVAWLLLRYFWAFFCFHLLAFCFSWKDRNTIMDGNEEKKLFFDFQMNEWMNEWMLLLFHLEKKRKGKE